MTSVTPTDAKGPPSTFINPAEGVGGGGGGGGGTYAGARSSSNNSNSPPGWVSPNYLKWSENLNHLLNDGTGVELLLKYLEQEDQDCFYMLRFWLAVRGSHQQPDQDHLNKCILAIYKGLFNKIKAGIRDDLRRTVTQRIRRAQSENKLLDAEVFSDARKVVETVMIDRMYPNFLSSDVYLNYVHNMQQSASAYAESFAKDELPKNFCQQAPLPVVNEDEELTFEAYHCKPGPGSLTYSTASTRLLHEQPHNLRVHHLSYNPVSRQDSEVQSLSSGARTDPTPDLALDDATGILGSTAVSTYVQKRKQMRINRNTDLVHIHEPRSSQPGIQERASAPEPKSFMSTLLPKLEKLRQEKETLEYVGLKLDSIEGDARTVSDGGGAGLKLPEDDDDQDILDRHVSRVWNELTPKQSPSMGTPVRPKSPDTKRTRSLHGGSGGSLKEAYSWAPSSSWSCYSGSLRRRDRDVASLFSTDSGNGTDRERHHRGLAKHKSVSESGGGGPGPSYEYSGHYPSGVRTWTGSHRTMTDSGVSVAGSTGVVPSQRTRDRSGLSSWHVDRRPPSARSSRSMFGSGSQIFDEKDAMSAHSRSSKNKTYHSKTKSEYQHPKSVPAQPFVADFSMPPYPYYSIDSQTTVEEATRRLEEWKGTRDASELQSDTESQSTCSQKTTSSEPEYTPVVYNFADENVPYLLRVYNSPVTLRVFKDHAPKRGNFRYFFQTECEDLGGSTPIFIEVTENDRVLPLWKNKVISKITLL